jgi:Flp pilus assembly protein TadD/mono/diheme cytochrome c family protein
MKARTMKAAAQISAAVSATAILAMLLVPLRSAPVVYAQAEQVTWRQHIAPLVYKNCTSCHHEGGSGPFALMTYQDAKRWGGTMKTVTESRYMPPWLPEPGYGTFAGDRRLTEHDIALVKAWVQAGMPEGDGNPPTAPVYSSDWQLGVPDMVLEMASPMQVPAGGTDLFENFILPVPLKETKWVRAMEIKPGSPRVVHHANLILDQTASLRRTHPADWQNGVPGMDILVDSGATFDPDSHFLFWKPDSTALVEPDGMPWRLDPGNDLVLNMHLKPTGKVESVRARIGLYFAKEPATERPMLLQLENDRALDIPPGNAAFVVEDSLKLPVAVDVLGIYPHAHYLGKRMEAWAVLPNGERRWLVLISNWDIDRQSVYRLATPLSLPGGSVVHMRYTYDNSAKNIRNPSSPPVRVHAGNRSVDEMAHLWLQVLPRPEKSSAGADPRMQLERAWMENRLQKNEKDDIALYNLASLSMMEGNGAQAARLFRRVLEMRPDDVRTITALGAALEASGDWQQAQAQYRAAIAKDPGYADAVFDLATLDLQHGSSVEAEQLFRSLIAAHPDDAEARAGLGTALLASDRTAEARTEFESALMHSPENFEALYGLARIAVDSGDLPAAEPLLLRAIATRNDPDAQRLLAMVYAGMGKMEKTIEHLLAWQKLQPSDPEPHRALAQVYSQMGQMQDAIREQKTAVTLAPESANDWNDLGAMEAKAGDKAAARRDFEHALQLQPANAAAQSNLKKLGKT